MDNILTSLGALVKEGFFGDVLFVKAGYNETTDVGIQFASSLLFVNLTVEIDSTEKVLPLVIKIQPGAIGHYTHFYNELLMYKEVIPALGFDKRYYPKLYFGKVEEENQGENILIFEDLRLKQFTTCKQSLFLDFEHISLAMKKIAMFHSRSFIIKHHDMNKFNKLTCNFKIHDYKSLYVDFDKMHHTAAERGTMAYQKLHGVGKILDYFLRAIKDTFEVWKELLSPEEPFGVIGHGDFCNNNLLWKYEADGTPVDCVLLDFQRGGYLSIGAELGFYLYMHTTEDLRKKHWDELLKIYWETLKENVPKYVEVPSFEDFLLHFARRAVYGYFIACFFLPFMMVPNVIPYEKLELKEKLEQARTIGGKEVDEKLVDIISHMYHKGYFHAFLESQHTALPTYKFKFKK